MYAIHTSLISFLLVNDDLGTKIHFIFIIAYSGWKCLCFVQVYAIFCIKFVMKKNNSKKMRKFCIKIPPRYMYPYIYQVFKACFDEPYAGK